MSNTAFENATAFFHACETGKGQAGCQQYIADGATFVAQSEPLVDVNTVTGYAEWMVVICHAMPDSQYEVHASAWDETRRIAVFFATFSGTNTGEGGPVPPTGKSTKSHYVYALTMNAENKIEHMIKIWNAPWAMRELGWA